MKGLLSCISVKNIYSVSLPIHPLGISNVHITDPSLGPFHTIRSNHLGFDSYMPLPRGHSKTQLYNSVHGLRFTPKASLFILS